MKALGMLIMAAFVVMAGIPVLLGMAIFAPIVIPMALVCALVENKRR